jgi:acetyltransferase
VAKQAAGMLEMNDARTAALPAQAAMNDLAPIMNAQSIVVIGASKTEPHELKLTGRPIKFLRKHGYGGRIVAVNPKYEELDGVPCYPSVTAIPHAVDVAAIMLPKARIFETVEECGRKGVKAVMIFSSGFGELGDQGRRDQDDLVALAHRYGMTLIGPNAAAVVSVANRMVLSFLTAFGQQELTQGNIAFASNSGALLSTGVRLADDKGFGFSLLASIGNEADVTLSDFVAHAVRDEPTKVIAAFVEGIKDGPGLLRAATEAAQADKPVVLVKVGTSDRGGRVATSHTGAITGDDRAFSAAFKQYGITRVKDLTELVDVATLFARYPTPDTPEAVIVSVGSGGAAELMADLADQHGVELIDFAPDVRRDLEELLTPFSILVNPIDIAGMTSDLNEEPRLFRRMMEYLLRQPSIGFFGVIIPVLPYMDQLAQHIVELVAQFGKPIIPMLVGGGETPRCAEIFGRNRIPFFATAEQGARGMKLLQDRARFQARRAAMPPDAVSSVDANRRERTLAALRALRAAGRSSVTLRDAGPLLADYGLPLPQQALVRSREEARAAAGTLGYPLAMKIESPKILHKTEIGGVRLGIATMDDVDAAFDALIAAGRAAVAESDIDGVLMQKMVRPNAEMILGSTRDPRLGHVLLAGLGGVLVELFQDVALRLPPLSPDEAHAMVMETRTAKLLAGYRGKAAADQPALERALVAFSELVADAGDLIDEIEINPLFVLDRGAGVLVGDALLTLRAPDSK